MSDLGDSAERAVQRPAGGASKQSRFHIISITMRQVAGDRAYHLRETFEASFEEACKRHAAFGVSRVAGVRCSVLRDGSTGTRYSLEESLSFAHPA